MQNSFSSVFISFFFALKAKLQEFKREFCQMKLGTKDKLAINWKNFTRVELQLEFTFRVRALVSLRRLPINSSQTR